MKLLKTLLFALTFAYGASLSAQASLLTVAITNSVTGLGDTNFVYVIPLNDNNPVLADGSIVTKGIATRAYPDTNGLLTIWRGTGFYAITNKSIALVYRFNDMSSNATAYIQSGWNTYGPAVVNISTGGGSATNIPDAGGVTTGNITNQSFSAAGDAAIRTNAQSVVNDATNALGGAVGAFCQRNAILDATARQQVDGFYAELQSYGITNFDAVLLGSRFNPTTNKTFFGRTMLTTNLGKQLLDGIYFTNSILVVPNMPDSRTGTVFVAWHYLPGAVSANDQWLAGVENSTNGAAAYQRWNAGIWTEAVQRTNSTTVNTLTNLVQFALAHGSYSDNFAQLIAPACTQYRVSTMSVQGTNTSFYIGGNQAKLNYYAPGFGNNLNPAITVPLNSLVVGSDLAGTKQPFCGVIDAVLIVWQNNGLATTNLVYGGTRALRWLESSRKDTIWVGDSTLTPLTVAQDVNSMPYWKQLQNVSDTTWFNWSYSGLSASDYSGSFPSNFLFGIGAPSWVTSREINYCVGINDFFLYSKTVASVWGDVNTLLSEASANNVSVNFWTPYVLWYSATTPLAYTAANAASVTNFNNTVWTNRSMFNHVFRRDLFVTQSMLNTNNHISVDGTHLNYQPNTNAQKAVSGISPDVNIMVDFDGNVSPIQSQRDGSSLTNVPASSITGSATNGDVIVITKSDGGLLATNFVTGDFRDITPTMDVNTTGSFTTSKSVTSATNHSDYYTSKNPSVSQDMVFWDENPTDYILHISPGSGIIGADNWEIDANFIGTTNFTAHGTVKLHGITTGTPADSTFLSLDSSGNVVKATPSGGGSSTYLETVFTFTYSTTISGAGILLSPGQSAGSAGSPGQYTLVPPGTYTNFTVSCGGPFIPTGTNFVYILVYNATNNLYNSSALTATISGQVVNKVLQTQTDSTHSLVLTNWSWVGVLVSNTANTTVSSVFGSCALQRILQ